MIKLYKVKKRIIHWIDTKQLYKESDYSIDIVNNRIIFSTFNEVLFTIDPKYTESLNENKLFEYTKLKILTSQISFTVKKPTKE